MIRAMLRRFHRRKPSLPPQKFYDAFRLFVAMEDRDHAYAERAHGARLPPGPEHHTHVDYWTARRRTETLLARLIGTDKQDWHVEVFHAMFNASLDKIDWGDIDNIGPKIHIHEGSQTTQ